VLTVHECKGLEFQMVLLHDFFSSRAAGGPADGPGACHDGSGSGSSNRWRVVYTYMKQRGDLDGAEPGPPFSATRHSWLLAELKHLYVMVTRWAAVRRGWLSHPHMQSPGPGVNTCCWTLIERARLRPN
jgi:ATP-dependent exoDNAse (exonuclease V) beta subunit